MSSELGIKVSKSTAGKIGLFGAMAVIIGGVIGIGIFFKNNGVFKNNNGNATGILLSWGIAIIIGIATAYSYGEIVSAKDKSANSGLGG
jgi:amino acid transporter